MATRPPIRTLLVDDNSVFCEDFRHYAQGLPGVEIVGEAGDGFMAVKRAAVLQPDLVLMDFGLPHLNGLEAMRKIRQTGTPVRIIIITAHVSNELQSLCLAEGADGYISKFQLCEDLPRLLEVLFPPTADSRVQVARIAPASHASPKNTSGPAGGL